MIIPDLTFVADANAILACNARPVIADINKNNFFLSISNLKKILQKRLKLSSQFIFMVKYVILKKF